MEEGNKNFDPEKDNEDKLYPILVNYLYSNNIYSKRIDETKSTHKGDMSWIHPDVIGFEISDTKSNSFGLFRLMRPNDIISFSSYEVKKCITSDNDLKRYFFQALSNSSWANYGYLVAWEIDKKLYKELKRMSESFGIGVIVLSTGQELFPARHNELDFKVIDKLCENQDFHDIYEQLIGVFSSSGGEQFKVSIKNLKAKCDKPTTPQKKRSDDNSEDKTRKPRTTTRYIEASKEDVHTYSSYPKLIQDYNGKRIEGWLNDIDKKSLLLKAGTYIFPESYTEDIGYDFDRESRRIMFEEIVQKDNNGDCSLKIDVIMPSPMRASILFRGKNNKGKEWRYEGGSSYK